VHGDLALCVGEKISFLYLTTELTKLEELLRKQKVSLSKRKKIKVFIQKSLKTVESFENDSVCIVDTGQGFDSSTFQAFEFDLTKLDLTVSLFQWESMALLFY
jgi:hypothetical protein